MSLFGDPSQIDYATAKASYYSSGPKANWQNTHASAYASMHPWEDFAESMNLYLDLMAIRETAVELDDQSLVAIKQTCFADLVEEILRLAVAVSEYNADMGLLPLLPESLNSLVLRKLEYIHKLRPAANNCGYLSQMPFHTNERVTFGDS